MKKQTEFTSCLLCTEYDLSDPPPLSEKLASKDALCVKRYWDIFLWEEEEEEEEEEEVLIVFFRHGHELRRLSMFKVISSICSRY